MTHRLDRLPPYAFPRLAALLAGLEPGGKGPPINLSLGEPKHAFPPFVADVLHEHRADYGRYPPVNGTPEFRAAVQDWLVRRYSLPAGALEPERHILPVNGTREGLFNIALATVPEAKADKTPAVLIPNPFYQCYAGAAITAGAEPVFVPARRETGFLPDYAGLPEDLLDRTALVYLCSPANPQGTVAGLDYLKELLTLARRFGFLLVLDECYAEIYGETPPPGGLEAAAALARGHREAREHGEDGNLFANLMVFHSLSKRSNLPGLRSGFCAGDAEAVARFRHLRNYGGAPSPLPVYAAAAAAWRDEAHVTENRALYKTKFDMAAQILGGRFGFSRPQGGFYLWLHVGDGEAAARKLWAKAGVKVLPGRYLGRDTVEGDAATNPGTAYIRAALVDTEEMTAEALRRMAQTL